MPPIFVSYRREDTEGEAGRLFDALVERFGKANVFFDVAAIRKGYDFRQAIDSSVSKCGVLLAIIGKHWIDQTGDNGNRRLDDPSDYVRLEIASALQRADPVPVIPVLVHGAKMPSSSQLPDDLKPLSYRNGTELTHDRWHSDLQLLIEELTPYVQPTPSPKPKHWWQSRLTIQISLLVIPLIAVGVFFSLPRSSSVPEPGAPTSTGPATTLQPSTPVPKPHAEPTAPPSLSNFAGTWTAYESTEDGLTHPFSLANPKIVTQSGSNVTIDGRTLPIHQDGTVTYQSFSAGDGGSGHAVATADQADLVDTFTYRIDGSTLIFETLFDTRRPYGGDPVGKKLRIWKYRR